MSALLEAARRLNTDIRKDTPVIRKLVVIANCIRCPHVTTERTRGAGCADDLLCKVSKAPMAQDHHAIGRLIRGYIEWPSELPKDGEIPEWCPLQTAEEGMYLEPKETT